MKRKRREPKEKYFGKTLTSMRETAYGNNTCNEIAETIERDERMRNDQELLNAAEEKRKKKAERRKHEEKNFIQRLRRM